MARPDKNTVEYFPHKIGDGKKMFFIEHKYKNDGYSTWYKLLEQLGATEYHYLDLNKEEQIMHLAAKCNVSELVLLSIINDLVKLCVFDKHLWDNKIIWCQSFIDSIQDAYIKRKNKCITIDDLRTLLVSLCILKQSKLPLEGDENTQTKLKKTKVEETKLEVRSLVFLLPDQIERLKLKFLNAYDWCLDELENHKQKTGQKYKSDYHALIGWVYEKAIDKNKIIKSAPITNQPKIQEY